ncbi:MAG TPA: hypothetical protein VNK92_03595 [Vicinamibacterales bacterium]|nr:hypothetical protein [Vicinamibacterales bacterium]
MGAAPAVLFGMLGATIAAALPAAVAVGAAVEADLGDSLMADRAADGVAWDWWQEFLGRARGLGATLVPSVIGFAAPLRNLSDLADAVPPAPAIAAILAVQLAVWIFLTGGVVDRLARARRTGAYHFFGACGACWPRLLRLALLAGAAYAFLFGVVHGWLFEDLYGRLTRDTIVERRAFAVRVGCYALMAALVAAIDLLFEYAKVRTVVEDRRSALGALAAAARFLRRHPGGAMALYLVNVGAFATALALYALVAPGVTGPLPGLWGGFLVGQIYILARLWVKLVALASQIAFFQTRLAHAGYAALPLAERPEPPVVEALGGR